MRRRPSAQRGDSVLVYQQRRTHSWNKRLPYRGSVGFDAQGEHKVRAGTLVIQSGLAYVPEYTNVYIHTHTVHSHEQTIKWKD